MSFLLDTDTCSAYMKGNHRLWQRFMQHSGRLHLSAITIGELSTWARRANSSPTRMPALLDLLDDVAVLEVTSEIGLKFGELRAALMDSGRTPPALDLLVATTAIVHSLTLVTHNVRDFVNVPGLILDDWLRP